LLAFSVRNAMPELIARQAAIAPPSIDLFDEVAPADAAMAGLQLISSRVSIVVSEQQASSYHACGGSAASVAAWARRYDDVVNVR